MTHQFSALKVAHIDFKLGKIWRELEIYVGSIESLWPTLTRRFSVVATPLLVITPI